MSDASCADRVSLSELFDYWLDELTTARMEDLEEHIFSCDSCTRQFGDIERIADGVVALATRGAPRTVVTQSVLQRLEREGVRMRLYSVRPGERVPCSIGQDDALVVTRLVADLSGWERIDLVFHDPSGGGAVRLVDVPVDRRRGEVIFTESGDLIRTFPATLIRMGVLGIDRGVEKLLGEYTLVHTPCPQ